MTPEQHLSVLETWQENVSRGIADTKEKLEVNVHTINTVGLLSQVLVNQAAMMGAMGCLMGSVQHILEGPHEE